MQSIQINLKSNNSLVIQIGMKVKFKDNTNKWNKCNLLSLWIYEQLVQDQSEGLNLRSYRKNDK